MMTQWRKYLIYNRISQECPQKPHTRKVTSKKNTRNKEGCRQAIHTLIWIQWRCTKTDERGNHRDRERVSEWMSEWAGERCELKQIVGAMHETLNICLIAVRDRTCNVNHTIWMEWHGVNIFGLEDEESLYRCENLHEVLLLIISHQSYW